MFEVGSRVTIHTTGGDEELEGRTGTVVPSDPVEYFEGERWVRLDGPSSTCWIEGDEVPFYLSELSYLED